jgi:hypothetical protein
VFVGSHDTNDGWPAMCDTKSDRMLCFGSKAVLPSFKPPTGQCLVRCIVVTGTGNKWSCKSTIEDHACIRLLVPNISNEAAGHSKEKYDLRRVST